MGYAAATILGLIFSSFIAVTNPSEDRDCFSFGPDVVSTFWDVQNYGSLNDVAAFSFGTDACNVGDQVLNWIGSTSDHPVIASNIYRIKNGRFEQVGTSWLKHGFSAAQSPNRCDCTCIPSDDNQYLGVGCADAYGAGTNGIQTLQGPRSEVNAYTGEFPFPPTGWGESKDDPTYKRLQVHHAYLEPTNLGQAKYIGEIQYVSAHDSLFGNQFNNSTWQPISIGGSNNNWAVSLSGENHVGEPAIYAWADEISAVRLTESRPPYDGSIIVGVLVSPMQNGWYQYEYAIQNVNAHRSVQQVSIPIPLGGKVLNPNFRSLPYHSGEVYDNYSWDISIEDEQITWATELMMDNPFANALRWSSIYNFRFISNVPPQDGNMQLIPFSGDISKTEQVASRTPNLNIDPCTLASSPCPGDVSGDGVVNITDVLKIFDWWGDCGDGTYAPPADANGDCCVNVSDLLTVIESWNEDCLFGGACCLPNGDCAIITSEDECQALDGMWNGLYTVCSDFNCNLTGACCLPDNSCSSDITLQQCTILDGIWGGIDSLCIEVTCSIGADNCDNAPIIEDGLFLVDTTNASTDGESHPKCDTSDGGYTGNDKWLKYIAPASGTLLISTCEDLGGSANYDTDLVFYHGSDCDTMEFVDCDDDNSEYPCGQEAGGWHSAIFAEVEMGEPYIIRVGGWTEGSVGEAWVLIELD